MTLEGRGCKHASTAPPATNTLSLQSIISSSISIPIQCSKRSLSERIPVPFEATQTILDKTIFSLSSSLLLSQWTDILFVQSCFVNNPRLSLVCTHRNNFRMKNGNKIRVRIRHRFLRGKFATQIILSVIEFRQLDRDRTLRRSARQSRQELLRRGGQDWIN